MTPTPQKILGWSALVLVVVGMVFASVGREPIVGQGLAALGVVCFIAWAATASITEKLDEVANVAAGANVNAPTPYADESE